MHLNEVFLNIIIDYVLKFILHLARQRAYIYLQPPGCQKVTFENANVRTIFQGTVATPLPATTWPPQDETSNFRLALIDGSINMHTEARLLGSSIDGLDTMINAFTAAHGGKCPQYVIFYSFLLPCNSCTDIIIAASKKLKSHALCNGTPFYLYVEMPQYTRSNAFFNTNRNKLVDGQTGIIWSNDPGPRV